MNDPTNLGIRLGIKLPESIVAKIAMTSDGADAWGLSDSGLVHLPLGKLYDYPILMPETTQVFLAMDDCNRGVASGTLKINNLGKGRLTYTVAASPSAALVYKQSSGLAPSTITFTMEPGRSGVVRQAGTNIWTGAGTQQGTPINLTLSSPDAINIPNTIRIFMNYRQSDQRGVIYPVPTTQNNNPSGTGGNTSGNEGLAGHPAGRGARPGVHHQLRLQPHRGLRHQEAALRESDSGGADAAPDGDGRRREDAVRGQHGRRIDQHHRPGPGARGGQRGVPAGAAQRHGERRFIRGRWPWAISGCNS